MNNSTLTLEELQKAVKSMKIFKDPPCYDSYFNSFPRRPDFGHLKIYEIPSVPVVQVREDFKWLTDEARARINNRLIELLGYREVIPEDRIYMFNNMDLMWPEMAALFSNITA